MDFATISAIIVSAVLVGLADWFFGGILFHDKYLAYPEVWRPRETNRYAIIVAQILAIVSAIAFVVMAVKLQQTDFSQAFTLAFWIWLIGPVPIYITNFAFMKIHWQIVFGQLAGWLVKLLAMALVTASFL
ncbi:MAG: DUF1761 family protein [Alphaproteobacteria bacterium]|nr:DUF1761 family protein [Alphaproteobacteria bacterium]